MLHIERGFVPLPKVEREQPEENIKILLGLPDYVDQDRIGVNLPGIARLCKLGGIRPLIIIGETEKETSHVIPEIVGINSDGSAMASKKAAKVTVPTFDANSDNSSLQHKLVATRWVGLNVSMNIDEIALRASEKSEGVHSAANWARELDKGFKVPIRRAGNQNLLHGLEQADKIDMGAIILNLGLFTILLPFISGQEPINPLVVVPISIAAFKFLETGDKNKYPDYRFSILPGYQIDRAIALGILSRTRILIKDLYQNKKENPAATS
jgi:hypothetical protein